MGLNYKEESVFDMTRAILVRVRKQEDDDNEGCFSTKPKTFKSALDVYLQLNFLVESDSCSSSMMQPLLHYCILQGSPLVPAVLLKFYPSSATPSFYLHRIPARYPGDRKGRKYYKAKKKFFQSLHSQFNSSRYKHPAYP